MEKKSAAAGMALAILLVSLGCGKSEPPGVKPAGQEKSGKTAALETAAVQLAHPQQGVRGAEGVPKAGPYPQGVSPLSGP